MPRTAGPPLPRLLLALGMATLVFDVGSVYVKWPVFRRGLTVGDLLEVAGVLAVLLLYRAVTRALGDARGAPGAILAVAAIAYALGNGIHVAANSIHDMLDRTRLGDPWGLAGFWDEGVGHCLVDGSRIAFAIGLTWLAARVPARPPEAAAGGDGGDGAVAAGGAAYGFLYFAAAVEGQTVPLALPFSIAYAVWSVASKSAPSRSAVVAFYRVAAWTSLFFLAVWGIWHRGFPEFSRTGFIP